MLIRLARRTASKFVGPYTKWRAQIFLATNDALRKHAAPIERTCNICSHRGLFKPFGWPLRPEVQCPKCGSLERHRLFKLWLDQNEASISSRRILHFAPEGAVAAMLKRLAAEYQSADLFSRADLKIDIEKMDLPNGAFDVVMCSHVLEHVNDRAALAEIYRVLSPGGLALLMVPIVEGWNATYENPLIVTDAERIVHFGQCDHVRFYGADFVDRIRAAGFDVTSFTASGASTVEHGLKLGEKVFVARKPASTEADQKDTA